MCEEIEFMTAEVKYRWTAKPRGFDLRLKAKPTTGSHSDSKRHLVTHVFSFTLKRTENILSYCLFATIPFFSKKKSFQADYKLFQSEWELSEYEKKNVLIFASTRKRIFSKYPEKCWVGWAFLLYHIIP